MTAADRALSAIAAAAMTPARRQDAAVMPRAVVIANPVARGVTRELVDDLDALLRDLGAEVTTLWTTGAGTATGLAADAVRGLSEDRPPAATVIAMGGDGTVREVAEGLVRGLRAWPTGALPQSDMGLFIVPAGAGNSAYRALWGNAGWRDALRAAPWRSGHVRHVDLLRVRETTNASVLGVNIGLGARVAQLLTGVDNVDETIRWQAIGRAIAEAPAFSGRVTLDGEMLYEGRIAHVAIGGVRRFLGGTLEFLPRAQLDDGRLDVCVIEEIDEGSVAELGGLIRAGGHIGHPLVRYAKGGSARVERTDGGELALEHDGDVQPPRRAVTVEVVPHVLPVAAQSA